MKKQTILQAVALAITGLAIVGCNLNDQTITDRIDAFLSDINNENWTGLRNNFDSSATDYDNANTENFWSTYFPADEIPYSRGSVNESGSRGTVTITSDLGVEATYTFTMTEEDEGGLFGGTTYRIRRIQDGSTVIFE